MAKPPNWELAMLGGVVEDLLVEQSEGPAVSVQDRANEGGMGLGRVARKGYLWALGGPQGWKANRPW